MKSLGKAQRARVHTAVLDAERATGLRFCVFVGRIDDDQPRAHAEAMFARGCRRRARSDRRGLTAEE